MYELPRKMRAALSQLDIAGTKKVGFLKIAYHYDYMYRKNIYGRSPRYIDFIGRLIRHIPPHYFNVIRHFGILASRAKKQCKEITDRILESPPEVDEVPNWRERRTAFRGVDPLRCRICGKFMRFVSNQISTPFLTVSKQNYALFFLILSLA
uniref:Transposase n=1 Tax=Candidatus Kentrum sp. TC TaxID=2126339 RepID=A0A450YSU6_9GAMM|nr:MAG: Putative transposase [Candidatus Kentron sp. TC]